jgi:hypothetical protein
MRYSAAIPVRSFSAIGGLLSTLRHRGALAVLATTTCVALAALLALAGCAGGAAQARPIDPGQLALEPGWIVAAPTPEVLERTGDDCGPAALAMVAGRWMVSLSLDEAVAAVPTVRETAVYDLRVAARNRGLIAMTVNDDRDILEYELRAGRPVIIELQRRHGDHRRRGEIGNHFEVVVAYRPSTQEVVTIDPAAGWRVRSFAALDKEWAPTSRTAMIVIGKEESKSLAVK